MEDTFSNVLHKMRSLLKKTINLIKKNQSKVINLEKTNFDLGLYHLRKRNINDAILRFYITSLFNNKNANAYYYLAKCYYLKKNLLKAKKNIALCININNQHTECKFLQKIITQEGVIDEVPESIIEEFYQKYASKYDMEYNVNEGYFTPYDLMEAASKYVKKAKEILDLGCGTGVCGKKFKSLFPEADITGIDIAHNMLARAQHKYFRNHPIYSKLIHNSVSTFITKSSKKFDVVISCLSSHYKRHLHSDLLEINKLLNAEGYACLAFEKNVSNNNDQTLSYGYENFCYNENYVESELKKSKFKILFSGSSPIKNDRIALIYVCQK